jgi:hypothetical protein
MKSFSIFFRTLPVALAIPPGKMVRVNITKRQLDVEPCSIASGDMTPAPQGQLLLTWPSGEKATLPERFVRGIVFNQ